MQKSRTHYQDQMRLTSHVFPLKKSGDEGSSNGRNRKNSSKSEALGITNLLLIINNWNFVRDNQNDSKVKKCSPADFQVQLKLSSTAFRNVSNPDCEFPFDKQAANFPYDSFLQLYKSNELRKFIREVRETYLAFEGPLPDADEEEDEGNAEDREVAKILEKKTRQDSSSELDSDSQQALETGNVTPPPPRKRGKRCLQQTNPLSHLY